MSIKSSSIKKNFYYSFVLKVSNVLFPLITFPYVARILSPQSIGSIDFSISIIQYLIIIASLGVPIYGIRESSKLRNSTIELEKTSQEILTINMISTIISYIIFIIIIFSVKGLSSYRDFLLIASINIVSTYLGVEWFFQGIEDFKYITVRNIAIKILALILIFTFVRRPNDVYIYFWITILTTSMGYLTNYIYVKNKYKLFKLSKFTNIKKHVKPILILFAMTLSTSIYINLDKVMLGVIIGDLYVGYYSVANKLVNSFLIIITSLGTVLLPRMSYYFKINDIENGNLLIKKSISFIVMLSLPVIFILIILANPIISIFAGESFNESILTMKIIAPIILFISLSNLIGIQILIANGKEIITLMSTIIGAVINFTLNYFLIPVYLQNGAAFATVVAELSVLVFQVYYGRKYIFNNIDYKSLMKYITATTISVTVLRLITYVIGENFTSMIFGGLLFIFSYYGFLLITKEKLVEEFQTTLVNKFRK